MNIEKWNGLYLIEGDPCMSKWVKEMGRLDHDQNLLPQLDKFIREGDVVIDVGANIGCHSFYYSNKVGETGKVFSFEPQPESFICIQHNLENHKNVIPLNKGVSDKNGYMSVESIDGNIGMSFLKEGKEVEVITIDGLKLDRVDFIKIDCEGMELNVLKGALETISMFEPVMLIEINDFTLTRAGYHRSDIFNFLNGIGYNYRNVYQGQSFEDSQLDIICWK